MGARAGCYAADLASVKTVLLISPAARVCRGEPRFRQSDLGLRDASLRLSGGVNASGTLTALGSVKRETGKRYGQWKRNESVDD